MTNLEPLIVHSHFDSPEYQAKNTSFQTDIDDITELFQVSQDKLDILMHGVAQEMHDGLNSAETDNKQSDLKMIPSFVTGNIAAVCFSVELEYEILSSHGSLFVVRIQVIQRAMKRVHTWRLK